MSIISSDISSTNQIHSACPHDCPDTCAMLSTVQDGKVVKVAGNPKHLLTAGVLCTKVSRYPERLYHKDRLLRPLRRVGPKGSGQFEAVSWDEALTVITSKLGTIASEDPRAILPYSYAGTMGKVQGDCMSDRFFHRLGASQLEKTICSSAGKEGLHYTLGASVGMPVETFAHSKLILIWGSNPVTSSIHFWRLAQQAKREGAKLVCIDPRRTETAEKCHEHLAPKPGTDAALALGLMHELVRLKALDEDYIREHTLGWPALKERVMTWTAERAAEICGLETTQIRSLAKDYASIRPASIRTNYGIQRCFGAANTVRALACLPALTGAWRELGGGLLLSSGSMTKARTEYLSRPDLLELGLGGRSPRSINMSTIGSALLRETSIDFGPKIKALVVYNANPVSVAPDSAKVVAGFSREDLFTVVLEHFQTDTADYADWILPATMQMEHWDIHGSYGHTDIILNKPAVKPPGECKPNSEIFRLLAKGMKYKEPCFQESDEELCQQAYDPELVSWKELEKQGFTSYPVEAIPFAFGKFPTPSGLCEFYSERLAQQGKDPLPNYLPNVHQPNKSYPLQMISPPARNFLNSSFANIESLQAREGSPLVEMNIEDAKKRNIQEGMLVEVYNELGSYRVRARIGHQARPGVVIVLGLWWRKHSFDGKGANELIAETLTDLGKAPAFYDCSVDVRIIND